MSSLTYVKLEFEGSTDLSYTQYLNAIWNVINFKEAERRFLEVAK